MSFISVKTIRDFKKESEQALSVFRVTMSKLTQINESIATKNLEVSKKIDALQNELAENHAILKANEKLVSNIENLLK